MITLYCFLCESEICSRCYAEEHIEEHEDCVIDVRSTADRRRYDVMNFLTVLRTVPASTDIIELIQTQVEGMESQRDRVIDKLEVELDITTGEEEKAQLHTVISDIKSKIGKIIHSFNVYKSDVSEMITNNQPMSQLCQYLMEEAPESEVVSRTRQLPSGNFIDAFQFPPIPTICLRP